MYACVNNMLEISLSAIYYISILYCMFAAVDLCLCSPCVCVFFLSSVYHCISACFRQTCRNNIKQPVSSGFFMLFRQIVLLTVV